MGLKHYRAVDANDRASRGHARPQKLKLQENPVLRNYVRVRLETCWSPEQIAGRLKRDYPSNARMHINHESTHRAVYANSTRNTFPDAERRQVLGHWESGLIIGSNTSQVATIVDRASRVVDLVKLPSRRALIVAKCLSERISMDGPNRPARTLTWDRGMEITAHQDLANATELRVYFADPHSPWQRGINENTDGLILRTFHLLSSARPLLT